MAVHLNSRRNLKHFDPSRQLLVTSKSRRAVARVIDRPAVVTRAARLQALEDRLLDALIEHHPNADRALNRLLNDVASPAEPCRRFLPHLTPTARHRIEDLLVGATLEYHPRSDRGLDHLLADLNLNEDEERERAEFDMTIDNDFDGMG